MRTIFYTIQLLLLTLSFSLSQVSYWEKVDTSIFARTHRMVCSDSMNCIAMFMVAHPDPKLDSCLLGKVSTNGGKTWTKNFHDCFRAMQYDECSYYWHRPEKFFSLSFPSSYRAFALLDSGKVMYSENYGKNWNRVIIDSSLLKLFSYADKEFAMRDDSLGIVFACFAKDSISASESHLYFTSDFGEKWVEIVPNSEEFKRMKLIRVTFPTRYNVKFIAYDSLEESYKLVSYEINTNNCSFKTIPITKSSAIAPCFYFQNENIGWIAGIDNRKENEIDKFYDIIYYTSDGGNSWEKQLEIEKYQNRGIFHIEFSNNSVGYALADNYGFRTSNQGLNWLQLKDSSRIKFSRYFDSYAVPSPSVILATTGSGDIYRYSIDYTSISEVPSPNIGSIDIFPNPVSSPNAFTVKIKLRNSANIKLKIYNTLGQLIDERYSEVESDEYEWFLATDNYPSGTYCIRVESNAGEHLSKVFVVVK